MMKFIAAAGALLGLTSVIMGAAGDHLLDGKLTSEASETFSVALRYHQLYAIVIFFMGLYGLHKTTGRIYRISSFGFLSGTIIFCGSLYASLFWPLGFFGYATPIGGFLLMMGWALVIHSVLMQEI